jgi:hypothetical protein
MLRGIYGAHPSRVNGATETNEKSRQDKGLVKGVIMSAEADT